MALARSNGAEGLRVVAVLDATKNEALNQPFAAKGWANQTAAANRLLDLLARFMWRVQAEIELYRRLETHRTGKNIDWQHAADDWMRNCFTVWKRCEWQSAIRQALNGQNDSSAQHFLLARGGHRDMNSRSRKGVRAIPCEEKHKWRNVQAA